MGDTRREIHVVMFCCDGLYQRDLMRQISRAFCLQAVVLQTGDLQRVSISERLWRYRHPAQLARYVTARLLRQSYEKRAQPMLEELFYESGRPPDLPHDVPIIRVADINDPATETTLDSHRPDIVCVNGTQLIRRRLRERAARLPLGMVNLHTGLSPYARGGNCNLFMLLERHPELVGITVHHIDGDIDGGDIIISDRPNLSPQDTYEMIDLKTFRLGNDRMIDAVRRLATGSADRVPQWTKGKLFLRRTGYFYEPYLHVQANRILLDGLIADYIARRDALDARVRLIGNH
jgi:methionyl-tRNA formyltransferase